MTAAKNKTRQPYCSLCLELPGRAQSFVFVFGSHIVIEFSSFQLVQSDRNGIQQFAQVSKS